MPGPCTVQRNCGRNPGLFTDSRGRRRASPKFGMASAARQVKASVTREPNDDKYFDAGFFHSDAKAGIRAGTLGATEKPSGWMAFPRDGQSLASLSCPYHIDGSGLRYSGRGQNLNRICSRRPEPLTMADLDDEVGYVAGDLVKCNCRAVSPDVWFQRLTHSWYAGGLPKAVDWPTAGSANP